MTITMLEARVEKANWPALKQAYRIRAERSEAGLVQSFLIQDVKAVDEWRIITIWSSEEALKEMRRTVETPQGVLIFREAGAEPTLSIFNVIEQIKPD